MPVKCVPVASTAVQQGNQVVLLVRVVVLALLLRRVVRILQLRARPGHTPVGPPHVTHVVQGGNVEVRTW